MKSTPASSNITITGSQKPALGQRIVGIGASAGGLQAIEDFITHTLPDSGLAYIVVQHLDPTHKTLLVELLQRVTPMQVHEAKQSMRIEPDCIYVIPPNTELSIANNKLRLASPSKPKGQRLPINVLLSSLASVQGGYGIGVILSGMGSDGTLGAQAIKATGGLMLVQDPESAQFDSMPKSVIAAGCADIVVVPAEMPARIQSYLTSLQHADEAGKLSLTAVESLQQIIKLVLQRTKHDLSLYKTTTLLRRIDRRMAVHGIASPEKYIEFLTHNSQETDLLFKEVLIGVTSFFRDIEVWEYLENIALVELLNRRANKSDIRAWCVGVSIGEEAYSLAMIFVEVAERLSLPQEVMLQIFASDISVDAIAIARRGEYPLSISASVSPERLARFFIKYEKHYQIKQNVRDMILFSQHDVIFDPPFTRLDLLICRNLLIYFDPILQRNLLPLFHYSLLPGGLLLQGSSETIGRFNHLFTPLQPKLRFFQRQEKSAVAGTFLMQSFPPLLKKMKEHIVSTTNNSADIATNLQTAADFLLLQVYAPAAVVVNGSGDIVYISGRTGKYLEPSAGKANWNFHAMAREGLRAPIAKAINQAAVQDDHLYLHGLQVAVSGGVQLVDVTVQKLHTPVILQGMTMIVFRDVATTQTIKGRHNKGKSAVEASHAADLQQCRDEIQALREETRTSREELQASNEELQSTNEELQSANEELTTSKEEMQSMNEELQTVNQELQSRLDDLALAQSDLQNTLNSIEIALLFLDRDLNVRRYTDRAAKIINLRESDLGRPLSDLTTSLQYPELHSDAEQTLSSLKFLEKQVATTDGRWFSVRIMPYRTVGNLIDGVVITLVDITIAKELESTLRQQ